MEECIFCKIIRKELPAKIEYEDEKFVAFHDINPKAPLHLLLVPKKHIESVDHLEIHDKELMGELILSAKKVASLKRLKGYKLGINVGREGGQIVDHLHLHLMANYDQSKNI
ncbi:MAG: histidine triad nucleotide-binding protein [Candidatus Wildermuthbacteria bacterium]|nr:histidine triad nucleotide-binding protein [Candidatus Wildermuthbacteria bacterium]